MDTRPPSAPAPEWRTVLDAVTPTVAHHFPVRSGDPSDASQDDLTHSLARFVLALWQARRADPSSGH